MSYADFAHVDAPSPREANVVSHDAVIFVDESEEGALVNLGSILGVEWNADMHLGPKFTAD